MEKVYRIFYGVDGENVTCKIYSYLVLEEKNTYYVVKHGDKTERIKKEKIGVVSNIDVDGTCFAVYLTDVTDKDKYIKAMFKLVQESAMEKVDKFQKIFLNAVICDGEMV